MPYWPGLTYQRRGRLITPRRASRGPVGLMSDEGLCCRANFGPGVGGGIYQLEVPGLWQGDKLNGIACFCGGAMIIHADGAGYAVIVCAVYEHLGDTEGQKLHGRGGGIALWSSGGSAAQEGFDNVLAQAQ